MAAWLVKARLVQPLKQARHEVEDFLVVLKFYILSFPFSLRLYTKSIFRENGRRGVFGCCTTHSHGTCATYPIQNAVLPKPTPP
jgi:hypothetical protein